MPANSIDSGDLSALFAGISDITPFQKTGQKQVFKCKINSNDIVIKFVPLATEEDNDVALQRTLREVKLIDQISSPVLPNLGFIDPGSYKKGDQSYYYYSEEYIPGKDLKELLQNGALSLISVIKLATDVTTAIKVIWDNGEHVHRDVKPGNVMWFEESDRYILIDMGLVLAPTDISLTGTGFTVGTLPYMSPEQLRGGHRALDFRSDLFSLGTILYECLSGTHPFVLPGIRDNELCQKILYLDPESILQKRPDCPAELAQVVEGLLNKRPHGRFRSCDILLEKLSLIPHS